MTLSKTKGCLILHGFGGALYEIEPLADYLKEQGFKVHTPVLPGHGQTLVENKAKLRYIHDRQWIEASALALEELGKICDEVYLIGFSMGGLLATQLVHQNKMPLSGIVLLNTPYYFWDFENICRNLIDDLKSKKADHLKHYFHSSAKLPLNAVYQFQKLLRHTKTIFKDIHIPLLIVQTRDDDSVQSKSAQAIFKHAPSPNKKVEMIDRGGHLVLLSPSKTMVCQLVDAFLNRY